MIGDDIDAALPELRAQAESMLHDLVRIEVEDGRTVDDLGTATKTWRAIYEGPGDIKPTTLQPDEREAAGELVVVDAYQVRVPHHVRIPDGVKARVLHLAPSSLEVAHVFEVAVQQHRSHAVWRRLIARKVT